ncbi:pentapeptide repeat-containing protein [Streptomyces sp. NBC_00386]|uniref:pentapeptide repeat-containing protein n=1 Tax=Streptomyces sp. NBC_00386 TaxID=2975734 RepID=UPI002E1D9D00
MSTPAPPPWPHCRHGADPDTDPIGCRGIHVPGHTACLAHLTDTARTAYLAGLAPGADIDHRGTAFTNDSLRQLLTALHDPATGTPQIGQALFNEARFTGNARFDGTRFTGNASFDRAQFTDDASFHRAHFTGDTGFGEAQFTGHAVFGEAQFSNIAGFTGARFARDAGFANARFTGTVVFRKAQFNGTVSFFDAQFADGAGFGGAQFDRYAAFGGAQFFGTAGFGGAQFARDAGFDAAQFTGDARFGEAQFSGNARFDGTRFASDVRFDGARFEVASELGPFVCAGAVVLSGAVFEVPVTLEIAAREVRCVRTRWESTATIRVRYAAVDLSHAVLTAPAAVITHPARFTHGVDTVEEDLLTGPGPQQRNPERARIVSVQGVDAAHLVLTDTDLSDCLFSGAFHLDQIRLEGRTTFASAPTGWHRRYIWPVYFTRRRVLAEEHHWRARSADQLGPAVSEAPDPHRWRRPGPHHPDIARTPGPAPESVAALYRQLRKAFEDGKNEPGAADFYYGECEMRRHDRTGTPKGERRLLWGYWLLSGYGLRASRAFTWLLAAMSLTVLLLIGIGLPTHDPDPATTGTLNGSRISLNTSTPDPALHGGWPQRMTWARAEKATRVAINSVVFRSSGQNLTTAGTYIEMISRLLEPTLLALGVLAVRGRIKR